MAAAAATLVLAVILVLLSRFKHDALLMTVNFLDIMIIDADTFSFLLTIYPNLGWNIAAAAAVVVPLIVLLWWFDPFRVRLRTAIAGGLGSLAALSMIALGVQSDLYEEFSNANYVSKFARSGVTGTLTVAADHFDLHAKLGFLLGAFSKTIEHEIEQNLDKLLGALGRFGFGSLGLKKEDFLKPGAVVQLGYPPARIDLITAIDQLAEIKVRTGMDVPTVIT